jgi:Flp pilus assembly pilin Flp
MSRPALRHALARLPLALAVAVTSPTAVPHRLRRSLRRGDRGQATAEYGLIILAAGGIALGVIAWASGTGSFTDMFESVVDKLSESL